MNDTNAETVNFDELDDSKKPANTYKGGFAPDGVVLSGDIEKDKVNEDIFGEVEFVRRTFFPKRRIGGKTVGNRKISGWKDVPIVKDWDSTYRSKEFIENFSELAQIFKEKDISEWFKTGEDLTNAEKNFNNALCIFINSFLVNESEHFDINEYGTDEILNLLEKEHEVIKHAENIYLNTDYQSQEDINEGTDEFNIYQYGQAVDIWMKNIKRMEDMLVFQGDLAGEDYIAINPEHRWEEKYTNRMLAKFKDLEESRFSNMWTGLISLTTYQDKVNGEPDKPEDWEQDHRGLSWFESMERLKESLSKILEVIRKISNRELEVDLHYLWVVEAHETGYPHIHLVIFGDVAKWLDTHKNKLRIKELLEDNYDLGRSGVATDFDIKPPEGDGAISDVSNYLMKYMKKNFGEIQSKYESEDLTDKTWGTLVYNACMWLSGYRTWGTSRSVGEVMKTEREESDKSYTYLGGKLTDETDKSFEQLVFSQGDDQMRDRLQKRKRFRSAVRERKQLEES